MIRGPRHFHDVTLSKTPHRKLNHPATDIETCLALWKLGNDTLSIARKLSIEESVVYNALAKSKGQRHAP